MMLSEASKINNNLLSHCKVASQIWFFQSFLVVISISFQQKCWLEWLVWDNQYGGEGGPTNFVEEWQIPNAALIPNEVVGSIEKG